MRKEPKWLIKKRKDIQNTSNKELLENTLELARKSGEDTFYEAQYDNSIEVMRNIVILEALQKELNDRLFCWLSKTSPTKVMPT